MTFTQNNQRVRRTTNYLSAIALMVAGLTVLASNPAVAASGCGYHSFGFEGTRLMNDGISTQAGPFAISLPAGTYDITLVSNDNHPSSDYQPDQTQEQWYVVLDNGYVSPPSSDIPADGSRTVTTIPDVTIETATAISVRHLLAGGINSVNVECVGFTPVAAPTSTTEVQATTIAPTTLAPTTIVEVVPPTTIAIAEPAVPPPPATKAPIAPQTTAAPATTATPTTAPPATTAAVAPVETEVLAKVEIQPPTVLARTGPENIGLTAVGIALLLAGFVLVAAERRLGATDPHIANL